MRRSLPQAAAIGCALLVLVISCPTSSAGADWEPPPRYLRTVVGPGLADMYPVDVEESTLGYYVMDAGGYRVVRVDATTGAITAQVGGHQGKGFGQFGAARALARDAAGTIYVADTANNRVQKFTADLEFVSSWGALGSGDGQFKQVYGVATGMGKGRSGEPAEVLYAADGAGRVQKFDLEGRFLAQFGAGGLANPRQLAVDPTTRSVFVVSAAQKQVVVYDQDGLEQYRFGGPGTGPGQFREDPRGVAFSPNGLVFVSDDGNRRVQVFNAQGVYQYQFGNADPDPQRRLVDPRGVVITSKGLALVADEWDFSLKEYSASTGTFVRRLFGTPPPVPGMNSPRGIAVDSAGRLYATDWWNQRIVRVDPATAESTAWGFRGNRREPGSLNFAFDVAVEPGTGRVFVANRESDEIEVFTADGSFVSRWGSRGSGPGQFKFPQGVSFAPDGTLLVTDSSNHRVQRFSISSTGQGQHVASYGSFGGSSSGAGSFNVPTGISTEPDGTIWVADTQNHRVQKRSPAGSWTAFRTLSNGSLFSGPRGVSVAPDGAIWVADSGRNRIIKMTTGGSTIFTASGVGVGTSSFDSPFDVAFGAAGQVYVSDTWNNRIVELGYQ